MQPNRRFLLADPAHFVALGFGSGLWPKGPGTAGTLATTHCFAAAIVASDSPFLMRASAASASASAALAAGQLLFLFQPQLVAAGAGRIGCGAGQHGGGRRAL